MHEPATLNIVIVGYVFGFPNGHGASARISQYARGLDAHGCKVHILCLKPTEPPDGSVLNQAVKGEFRGASFEYTSGTSIFSNSRIFRYYQNIKGVIGAFRSVQRLRKKQPIHAVLYYGTDSPYYTMVLWLLAKMYRASFIGENTEAPFVYSRTSVSNSFNKWLVTRCTHKLFDGFVVISTFLEKTFRQTLRRGIPILRLPVLVETSAFESKNQAASYLTRTIVYCGNLNHEGEVGGLLEAWSKIKSDFPAWKIRIIGDNSSPDIQAFLLRLMKDLCIEECIEFTGLVARQQLVELLMSGDVMALPRSSGLFSEAGLPNKLGEYLATGKPVVTTNVGDIRLYLQDRVDAFLVQPDDVQTFADILRYVLTHPVEAKEVGENGMVAAQKHFDTHNNCKRLINFIQQVNSTL